MFLPEEDRYSISKQASEPDLQPCTVAGLPKK
jgi:hypothetical protein